MSRSRLFAGRTGLGAAGQPHPKRGIGAGIATVRRCVLNGWTTAAITFETADVLDDIEFRVARRSDGRFLVDDIDFVPILPRPAEPGTMVITEIANLDTRLSTDIVGVRAELESFETRLIRGMVGTVIAMATLTVGILRLLG